MDVAPPHTGTLRTLHLHDAAVGVSCEDAGIGGLAQLFDLSAQLSVFLFKVKDPRDTGQVDAVILAELLGSRQPLDVAQGIPPGAAAGAARSDQSQPVVLSQRLRVDVRYLCSASHGEQRQVNIETHIISAIEVGTPFDQRDGAHLV